MMNQYKITWCSFLRLFLLSCSRVVSILCAIFLPACPALSQNLGFETFSSDPSQGKTWSFDGRRLLLIGGAEDKAAFIWNLDSATVEQQFRGHTEILHLVAFSPDGTKVATSSSGGGQNMSGRVSPPSTDDSIRIWDAASGKEISRLKVLSTMFQFSPDGSRILIEIGDLGDIEVWDIATSRKLFTLNGRAHHYFFTASFSPSMRTLLVSEGENGIKVYDYGTGKERCTIAQHSHYAAYSPDGTRIVVAAMNAGEVQKIWNATDCHQVGLIDSSTNGFARATYSQDGKRIITNADARSVRLWDTQAGTEIRQFTPQGAKLVVDTQLSADGSRLLTRSEGENGNMEVYRTSLWDVASGQELHKFDETNRHGLTVIGFSPDGSRILSLNKDGRMWSLWDAKTGDLLQSFVRPRLD